MKYLNLLLSLVGSSEVSVSYGINLDNVFLFFTDGDICLVYDSGNSQSFRVLFSSAMSKFRDSNAWLSISWLVTVRKSDIN